MTTPLAIALFIVIWWTLLFAVLPFSGRSQGEAGEVVPGTPEGAPSAPRLIKVFAINTVLAAVVFGLVLLAIRLNVLGIEDGVMTPGGGAGSMMRR